MLENKKAIKNYFGAKTIFKFNCLSEGLVTYKNVAYIKDHHDSFSNVELDLHYQGEDVLDYDTIENLLLTFDVFEVKLVNEKMTREVIFDS